MTEPCILEIDRLTVVYPPVTALDHISLCVRPGEIHAVLGEQGAGKTTLTRALSGVGLKQPYQGQISVAGRPIEIRSPRDAIQSGIGVVPRRLAVFEQLSVAENIALGNWQTENKLFVNRSRTRRQAAEILRELNLSLDLTMKAGQLSAAQQRLLTIARALGTRPRILVLDEPASTAASRADLSQLIRVLRWAAGQGIASLYLTPRVSEVLLVADRASVLRDGVVVGDFERAGLDEEVLARLMISERTGNIRDYDEDVNEGPGGLAGVIMSFLGRRG